MILPYITVSTYIYVLYVCVYEKKKENKYFYFPIILI